VSLHFKENIYKTD